MLEAKNLRKAYGNLVALDDVSLSVGRGEMVGLLGPNGAGKSTTVSILCGLLRPDAGEVLLDGRPIRGETDPAKYRLGLVPQDLAVYEELSGYENLRFFGSLYRITGSKLEDRISSALEFVGLAERSRDRVAKYSGGMKRRLNLAAALLHDPQLLLLDEPTVGVDPQSRNAIFENLEALKAKGKSLLYTTHYMEEAERLCDRIVVIDRGRIVANDTLRGLYRLLPASNRIAIDLEVDEEGLWLDDLRGLSGVESVTFEGGMLKVGVNDVAGTAPRILGWLADKGHAYSHFTSERADLETVFLSLTGRSLRDS